MQSPALLMQRKIMTSRLILKEQAAAYYHYLKASGITGSRRTDMVKLSQKDIGEIECVLANLHIETEGAQDAVQEIFISARAQETE